MSNSSLFVKSGFPRAALNNGIGRYVCQLQRLTIKFCKNNGSSRGIRDYLERDLIDFAKNNPGVVVYLKPRRHRSPVIKAEYLNGRHYWIDISNFSRGIVAKWLELIRTQDDDGTAMRLRKMWHTDFPSIQGPWTPFTFSDPSLNLAQLPDKKFGAFTSREKTATEQLLEMYEARKRDEGEEIPVQEAKEISN